MRLTIVKEGSGLLQVLEVGSADRLGAEGLYNLIRLLRYIHKFTENNELFGFRFLGCANGKLLRYEVTSRPQNCRTDAHRGCAFSDGDLHIF